MIEVEELDCIDYYVYKKDAFIYKQMQTESGREYLSNAFRLEQTKPDRGKLRQFANKEV